MDKQRGDRGDKMPPPALAPLSIEDLLGKVSEGSESSQWRAISGQSEEWMQRETYPLKKHAVTLATAGGGAGGGGGASGAGAATAGTVAGPSSPRPAAPTTAGTGAGAAAQITSVAPGFITQHTVNMLLDSVLGDFDPLTSLYTPPFRKKAVEELRRLLMDFGSSGEISRSFGQAKTQRVLTALSGAKHPDAAALSELLSFVLDREVKVPEPVARAPRGAPGASGSEPRRPKN